MLISLPKFRTNVNLFESVICLVPANLWNFLEARMLYDKCIEASVSAQYFFLFYKNNNKTVNMKN